MDLHTNHGLDLHTNHGHPCSAVESFCLYTTVELFRETVGCGKESPRAGR